MFVAAALAMWLGVSSKDLAISDEELARKQADRRDPSFGAQI